MTTVRITTVQRRCLDYIARYGVNPDWCKNKTLRSLAQRGLIDRHIHVTPDGISRLSVRRGRPMSPARAEQVRRAREAQLEIDFSTRGGYDRRH